MKPGKWSLIGGFLFLVTFIGYVLWARSLQLKAAPYITVSDPKEIEDRLKANPTDVAALVGRAFELLHAKRVDEAASTFRKVVELNPKDTIAKVNLAMLLERRDPEAAVTLYHEVIASDSDWADVAKKRLAKMGAK